MGYEKQAKKSGLQTGSPGKSVLPPDGGVPVFNGGSTAITKQMMKTDYKKLTESAGDDKYFKLIKGGE